MLGLVGYERLQLRHQMRSDLLLATQVDDASSVARILAEAPSQLSANDGVGNTPLTSACGSGSISVVRLLLSKGARVGPSENLGRAPLLSAVVARNYSIVSMLLEHGADSNTKTHDGWTPLFFAAANGDVAIVNLLLKYNGAVDTADHGGWTALYVTVRNGRGDTAATASALVAHGADPDRQTIDGDSPRRRAEEERKDKLLQVMGASK